MVCPYYKAKAFFKSFCSAATPEKRLTSDELVKLGCLSEKGWENCELYKAKASEKK
ncbi:MAG: hypothetical protein FGF53_10290 [Candidatus Brockarchaeota archaeon]|nr:hypothetical protein [Candidatus Brockarchaeota archaeon]